MCGLRWKFFFLFSSHPHSREFATRTHSKGDRAMKFPKSSLFSAWRDLLQVNSLRAAWMACAGVSLCLAISGCSQQNASTQGTSGEPRTQSNAAPITIGCSDWPGWVAWDIADQQGFFKKRGVNVKLVWFPVYTDSLNALAAGQVDANGQTWSDTMGPLAKGMDLKAVLVNDNSFGNDALIAQPGIKSVKELKGKKVATELGTVDHFLLLKRSEE